MSKVIPKEFYLRNPAKVARDLLGKLLVRVLGNARLSGIIVETEAYFGVEDPASRARKGGDLARTLYGDVGLALVYGIHRQWLLNVVAHEEGEGGAVLIRALEPLEGIEIMLKNRPVKKITELTNGPGKLTKALLIDKYFHKKPLYSINSKLFIEYYIDVDNSNIERDFRIGVSKDLEEPYRYFIKYNKYISKKKSRKI